MWKFVKNFSGGTFSQQNFLWRLSLHVLTLYIIDMPKRRRKKRLQPEPGAWVNDEMHGMPKLKTPNKIPAFIVITTAQVREHIEYEGLGCCIWEYIPSERISDKRLRLLWSNARNAMLKIVNHLEKQE